MTAPIRVSIGTQPDQWLAAAVLKSSIIRRTDRPVEFTESWDRTAGWHPVYRAAPSLNFGTAFSQWRWLVPLVYGHAGRAIYLDADQVVLADIAELFGWPLTTMGRTDRVDAAKFAAVIGAEGNHGSKGPPEPTAVQTSVMVYDCARCDWDYAELVASVNAGTLAALPGKIPDAHFRDHKDPRRVSYGHLMTATWVPDDEIARLDPAWNHLNLYEPGRTRLCHFTVTAEQCWRTGDTSKPERRLWQDELRASITAGHITVDEVQREVNQKHVHRRCLEAL